MSTNEVMRRMSAHRGSNFFPANTALRVDTMVPMAPAAVSIGRGSRYTTYPAVLAKAERPISTSRRAAVV